jgi:hypothetical protein
MAETSVKPAAAEAQSAGPATVNPPQHNPERAAWFEATKAPAYGAGGKLAYFWCGIGVRNDEILALKRTIEKQCHEEGLCEVEDLAEPAIVKNLAIMVNNIFWKLPSLIMAWPQEPIPKRWLEDWVMAFILEIWLNRQNTENTDQNVPAGIGQALLGPGTHIHDGAGFDKVMNSIRAPSPVDRGMAVFKLLIMSEDGRTELATEELPAYKVLSADSHKQFDAHYSLEIFLREFETQLNTTGIFREKKINLRHGTFGYDLRTRFKEIKRQPEFENAVSYLFTGFEKDGTIEFLFYMENKSEKKNRENRQKAQARIRDQIAARKITVTQPSAAAGAVPSSRTLTSHEKTLGDLERPISAETRTSGESNRIASPSKGIHRNSTASNSNRDSHGSLRLSTPAGQSNVVEQVLTTTQPPSTFSISPTSPTLPTSTKKVSAITRIGNFLRKGKEKTNAKEVEPAPSLLAPPPTPAQAQPGSAKSSIKRGTNNKHSHPASQTQASSSTGPTTADPKSAVPSRLATAGGKLNRVSGIFKRTFSPVPESPIHSLVKETVTEEPTEESKAAQREEKLAILGKELERETYVKGRTEEEKVVDDILAAYQGEGESDNDEKILEEVEDEDDEVAKDNMPEYLANQ